jgi:hypothetical protein
MIHLPALELFQYVIKLHPVQVASLQNEHHSQAGCNNVTSRRPF